MEAWNTPGLVSFLRQTNWQCFLAVASQDLYPYLASRLEPYLDCIEPPLEWEVLFKARRLTAVHNLRMRHELGRVVEALGQSGIAALALKGIVLAYKAYGDPSLRPMMDLDILVPPGKREKAFATLRDLGFARPDGVGAIEPEHSARWRPHEFCSPLRLRGSAVLLEVHTQLECSEPQLPAPLQEFWSRSVTLSLKGLQVRTLCPEDFLFHLCLHASRHHGFEAGLRSLLDVRVLLDSFAPWDWEGIAARSIRHRCAPWMYLTLEAARELVGAPVPDLLFHALPRPAAVSNLRRLADEQIWSARCGKPRLPIIPTLLSEPSLLLTRMRLVRRKELGTGPVARRFVQAARLSWRRLLVTLKIVIPRFRQAWEGGQWGIGAVWASARLTRHANTLFRLAEQEAGISQTQLNGAQPLVRSRDE